MAGGGRARSHHVEVVNRQFQLLFHLGEQLFAVQAIAVLVVEELALRLVIDEMVVAVLGLLADDEFVLYQLAAGPVKSRSRIRECVDAVQIHIRIGSRQGRQARRQIAPSVRF